MGARLADYVTDAEFMRPWTGGTIRFFANGRAGPAASRAA